MSKTIVYISEIITKTGVYCIKENIKNLKSKYNANFVIANADAASGGFGLGKNHSIYLHKMGIDVITSGDLIYNKKDMQNHLETAFYILRPANFPHGNPGRGWRLYLFDRNGEKGDKKNTIAVLSLLGQGGFRRIHPSNPFSLFDFMLDRIQQQANIILIDFHSVYTAEKVTMGLYVDGKVSAVIGSGMRAQTTDARILEGGTAVITDAGRTGSQQSVGGFSPENEIQQRIRGVPILSKESWLGLETQGVVIRVSDSGKAESIEAFRIPVESPANELAQ